MNLIKVTGDLAILDADAAAKVAEFERLAKEVKAKEDELKKQILREMEEKGIVKLDTGALSITYIAPTERETLDSKALREELPDIYDTYVKLSPVKSQIRVRLK